MRSLSPDLLFFPDMSDKGWGAYLGDHLLQAFGTKEQVYQSICGYCRPSGWVWRVSWTKCVARCWVCSVKMLLQGGGGGGGRCSSRNNAVSPESRGSVYPSLCSDE